MTYVLGGLALEGGHDDERAEGIATLERDGGRRERERMWERKKEVWLSGQADIPSRPHPTRGVQRSRVLTFGAHQFGKS